MVPVESISAFGDGLWVFLVLPSTPSQLVPLFFLSLGWLPGLLRLGTSMNARSPRLRTMERILTILAGFILAHFPLYAYMLIENVQHSPPSYFVFLTLSVVCCSVRWCMNRFLTNSEQIDEDLLVDRVNDSSRFMRFKQWLHSAWTRARQYSSSAMMEAASCRYRTYTYVAIADVIIYGLLANIFLPGSLAFNQLKYSEAFTQLPPMLFEFRWVAIGMISTYLTYSTAQTMCKVRCYVCIPWDYVVTRKSRFPCKWFHSLCQSRSLPASCFCWYLFASRTHKFWGHPQLLISRVMNSSH